MCPKCLFKKNTFILLTVLAIFSFILNHINSKKGGIPIIISPTQSLKQPPKELFKAESNNTKNNVFLVKKVIDGDTLVLEDGRKVRYIGINTPELSDQRKKIECFAEEAYQKNKQLVEGKRIILEKDVSETDKYNRLLRYVYLLEENSTKSALFVNDYLVKEGFAYAMTIPPDVKYSNIFLKSQQQARENKKGLWGKCLTHKNLNSK